MLFLTPYLFPSARLMETAAAQDLHLPALQTLLARGRRERATAGSVEAALCEALGIVRQQDWPIAPITLAADGGAAGDAYWLRADPVHLRVMRDRIVLADSAAIDLTREEADALALTISQHFGDDLTPVPLHPRRWYLRYARAPQLITTPLSEAVGRDIDPLLPQGADAMQFRAELNELQMLLHDHPVNQAREARGALPVNSLWLWGGGHHPAASLTAVAIYTEDFEAQALGAFCRARVEGLPTHLNAKLLETNGIVLLDALAAAGQVGDAYGWREALRGLERDWFVPLLGALRKIGPQGLSLLDPVSGKALQLHPHDAWKLWRRPQRLISALA